MDAKIPLAEVCVCVCEGGSLRATVESAQGGLVLTSEPRHRDSAHVTSSWNLCAASVDAVGPASPERVGCGAACVRLCSTEVVFGLAGRRVVDCIKVAAKGEPKDEVFQGERAKARVKVLCTVGQAQHPLSIRGGGWRARPGPLPELCARA